VDEEKGQDHQSSNQPRSEKEDKMKDASQTTELNERELPNDYPINYSYLYVVDGRPWKSPDQMTVGELKRRGKFSSVKNCDISGRDLWHQAM